MDCYESNLFEKLPDEVLQLIFAAIGDCKTLLHCMVVSKSFQVHASKVNALKISFPTQFSTYDQKLWNIYSMVKTFKALESLIVCVGQPKKEPPASWARCMRYAEIGVAVEKFVFMAAKSGDFVEFDSSLGLRSQLTKVNDSNKGNKNIPISEYKIANACKDKVDHGLLVNDKIVLFGEEDEKQTNNNLDVEISTSRQEQGSSLYTIRTIDSTRTNETTLIPHLTIQETSNQNIILHNENNIGYEKGETSERSNCRKGQISLCKNPNKCSNFLPSQPQVNDENLHIPIINFHLKQVIAPSNDVLKRMVPVIVFAIVQGLDEFRDTLPNFIEKFVKLKRFVFVDIVESLTVHIREHQIQQVRTQRLETINKFITKSIVPKSNMKTNRESEKYELDKTNVSNKNKKQITQTNQDSEVKHIGQKTYLDVDKITHNLTEVGDFKNAPLKLQIHEIQSNFLNSKLKNKPSMFESGSQEESICETNPKLHETKAFEKPNNNQIIKSPMLNNICHVCQNLKPQGNCTRLCWHRFQNGFSTSIPSINFIKSSTLNCNFPPLPHVERLIGNWSCDDPSLKEWLKGKQSLTCLKDISQVSNIEMEKIECVEKEHKKMKDCTQIESFEEIMACRLRDDCSKQLPNIPIITNSKTMNERMLNQSHQTLLNSYVTFSNNQNFTPTRKNVDQLTPGPTTSVIKKPGISKNIKISRKILESLHVNNLNIEEASQLNPWEKPPSCYESSGSSSTSFNSSKGENPNLNFEVLKSSIPETKLYRKKKLSLKKTKCLDDLSNNSKTCPSQYKSNYKKYGTLKESKSNYIEKHSFKRGLQKETSRRREGDRASRIANSRRHGNHRQSKNDVWTTNVWTKKDKKENVPLLECGEENQKDFWNFTNKSICFTNRTNFDIINKDDQNNCEDVKGKKIVAECSNDEITTSSYEIPSETYDQIITNRHEDEANDNNTNNNISNINILHESEQLSSIASNHNEPMNSIGFEGVVLVPYETNSTIVNNRLQGLCDLEDINVQSQTQYDNTNFTNIEDYNQRVDISPNLSPRDNDKSHSEVAWIGSRARERSRMRRLGHRSRTRSMRRENHAEREREVRRERLHEDVQKRQCDLEQEALFFDISFWRSEQVATENYILSEVSMCIATHDAKPLTEEELKMLSTCALAGPLLTTTVTYVNEQIKSHNL